MDFLYSGTKDNRKHIFGHCMFAREHLPYNSSWLQYLLQISSMQGFCFWGSLDIGKSSMADLLLVLMMVPIRNRNVDLQNDHCEFYGKHLH